MPEATITIRLQVGDVDEKLTLRYDDAQTELLERAVRQIHDESKHQNRPIEEVYFLWAEENHNALIHRQDSRENPRPRPTGVTP